MTLYSYFPNKRCEVRIKEEIFLAGILLNQLNHLSIDLFIYIGNFNKFARIVLTVLSLC